MASKKTKKTIQWLQFRPTDFQKEIFRKICGLVFVIFTASTALSLISYLFTWVDDASALNDPTMMDSSKEIANWGGKGGFRWAYLMVGRLFGVAGISWIVLLSYVTAKLFAPEKYRLLRSFFLIFTATYILSVFFSFVGIHAGIESWLPNGLGGICGAATVIFLENLFKPIITFLIILFFIVLWITIVRPSFFTWLGSLHFDFLRIKPRTKEPFSFKKETPQTDTDEEEGEVLAEENEDKGEAPVEKNEDKGEVPVEKNEDEQEEGPQDQSSGLIITTEEGGTYDIHVTEDLVRDIDYKDKMSRFVFPSLDLLDDYTSAQHVVSQAEINLNSEKIKAGLSTFKIEITAVHAIPGPTVTLYKLTLGEGVKISQIRNVAEDLGVFLGTKDLRVVKLADSVGVEVANAHPSIVPLKSMLADDSFRNTKAELPIAIGYTISREVKTFDLADAPHLLIAGATKMGKSVGLNVIISSLLYTKHPSELKFVFIDPKMVEFSPYAPIMDHYMAVLPNPVSEEEMRDRSIITSLDDADLVLKSLCVEMDDRYRLMREASVNQVKLYNQKYIKRHLNPEKGHRYFPYIVAVIDEYADLTMSGFGAEDKARARRISQAIIRLAQKGRAAGLHVILATQRPSADVVTSVIKANFPMRIAFRVVSHGDSQTILGSPGAEKLIGKGDMLLYNGASDMQRVQCAYISGEEITSIAKHIGNQTGLKQCAGPFLLPEPPMESSEGAAPTTADVGKLDARFEEAARIVVESGSASTTYVQRRLGIGYAKAARIMDQLEAHGVVGPQVGARPRDVLIGDFQQLQAILDAIL
ncbi:MAG: DNA translocase FtsK 4TM domain-containing protein [Bacteroidales bacterium]|nr:DNA translocase FtsK 4TM domain-containing protein [Bacteroidales bacterium]